MHEIDIKLFFLINHGTANPFFDGLMLFLSHRGYFLVLPCILYVLYRGMKGQTASGKSYLAIALWAIVISVCSLLLAEVTEYVVKVSVARVRPCHILEGVRLLVRCPEGYSMPSGHAMSSFAFAMPLIYLTRRFIRIRWRLYPLILASLISFSRVYIGVHYPSDVSAGALLGTAIALVLSLLYEWNTKRISGGHYAGD